MNVFPIRLFCIQWPKVLFELTVVSYRKMATLRGILKPEILQRILSLGLDEVSLGFFPH